VQGLKGKGQWKHANLFFRAVCQNGRGKCIFGRFPKPLRSIPRGGLLLLVVCALNFGSVMLCCGFVEKFDDLEMVG